MAASPSATPAPRGATPPVLIRDDLRRRGFEQVKRFSWDRTARRILQIYRDVVPHP